MGEDTRGERRKRLAEALRVNLKRRKAQQRERSAGSGSVGPRQSETPAEDDRGESR